MDFEFELSSPVEVIECCSVCRTSLESLRVVYNGVDKMFHIGKYIYIFSFDLYLFLTLFQNILPAIFYVKIATISMRSIGELVTIGVRLVVEFVREF